MHRNLGLAIVLAALVALAACTVNQTEAPVPTGPSVFATSITVSANPDTIALGQSPNSVGQKSTIIARVFDANGQPQPSQLVRFEALVNGKVSDCGQLSLATAITGSDGRAATEFVAPGTPPDCPNFNADGTVTIRATPVGTDFRATALTASSVGVFMAVPSFSTPAGGFTVNFLISPNPGRVNTDVAFSDAGSISPGHSIVSFRWVWSDGAGKTGSNVTHDFAVAGTYTATLTATDDIGQTSFKTAIVSIEN